MKRIEFFEASDIEMFVNFAIENELSYTDSTDGTEWIVDDETANKIQEAHPYYDYWNIETIMKYEVIRTRYNNEIIYQGENWLEAMKAIMIADECDEIDFIENGKVIWNGEENTWGDLLEYDMRYHNGEYVDNSNHTGGMMI